MIKISGMTLADPLTGEESVPVIQNGQNRRATTDMFNVGGGGGVESVTLEQLETLIANEEINIAGHYEVTGKNWLLTGIANNKLVDFAGQGITIGKDDTLPVGVEPLILWVDTGVLTGNSYYHIPPFVGYKFMDAEASGVNTLFYAISDADRDVTIAQCEEPGRLRLESLQELGQTSHNHALKVIGYHFSEVSEYRMILKFEKLQL